MLIALGITAAALAVLVFENPSIDGGDIPMTTQLPAGGSATAEQDGFALFAAEDYAAAITALRPRAEDDDVSAQCKLGIALTRIAEAEQRHHQVEAVKWLDQCIRRYEHPDEADNDLARQLIDELIETAGWDVVGDGRYQSFQFQQAKLNAEQGRPNGAPESLLANLAGMTGDDAFQLGADLYNGTGMPIDFEKGTRAFKHAAERGVPEAAFNLGIAYYGGKGVKADPVTALNWFKAGSDGEYADAAMMVGIMLARGHGAARDVDQAVFYLRRAEELGNEEAGFMADAVADGAIPY